MRVTTGLLALFAFVLTGCEPSRDASPGATPSLSKNRLEELKKSAVAGDANAQLQLAQRYDAGDGVSRDLNEAFIWYQRAAESGVVQATLEVAGRYRDGTGVRRDYEKAKYWWGVAAQK